MKPRINDFVTDEVLTSADMNSIQTAIRDVTKCAGNWIGNEPYVMCATGSTSLKVGPFLGVVIAGVELAGSASETTVTLDGAFSGTGWWYLYAKNNGSDVAAFEFSQTVPDAYRVLKTGDTSRRYVCSVYVAISTLHSEAVLSFRKERGVTTYRWSGLGIANFVAKGAGADITSTDVSLATYLPPHARMSRLSLLLEATAASVLYYGKVNPKGDTLGAGTTFDSHACVAGYFSNTADFRQVDAPCETDSSQNVVYLVSPVNAKLTILVRGFEE